MINKIASFQNTNCNGRKNVAFGYNLKVTPEATELLHESCKYNLALEKKVNQQLCSVIMGFNGSKQARKALPNGEKGVITLDVLKPDYPRTGEVPCLNLSVDYQTAKQLKPTVFSSMPVLGNTMGFVVESLSSFVKQLGG